MKYNDPRTKDLKITALSREREQVYFKESTKEYKENRGGDAYHILLKDILDDQY